MANKHWKEAATLVTLARNKLVNSQNNVKNGFNILFQKRSGKSDFMPNNIVFPGGVVDKADLDKRWMELFKKFDISSEKLSSFQKPGSKMPMLFKSKTDEFSKHIALRITAIRETFEEVGLLLCRFRNNLNDTSFSIPKQFDISEWQQKVNDNPSEFYSLCEHLDCYPDIWALHLWSNWLTPTFKPKRFDTAFFISFLEIQPEVFIDQKEVTEYMWSTPYNVLQSFKRKEVVLATPQWYELTKLNAINDFNELNQFAARRSRHGCELMMPIYQKCKDSTIVLFPGDFLYPDQPDLTNNNYKLPIQDKMYDELRNPEKSMHRMVYQDPHEITCEINNYASKYYEMLPTSHELPVVK